MPPGSKQFGGFHQDSPYGAVGNLNRLEQAAPVPSKGNAPQRAQRKAVRNAPPQPQEMSQPIEAPNPSYDAQLAHIWGALAQALPDNQLVQQYAQVAAQRVS